MSLSACLTCRHARSSRTVGHGQALCFFSFVPVDVMHVCHDFEPLSGVSSSFHDAECSDGFELQCASTTATKCPSGHSGAVFDPATNSPSGEFSTVFPPATDSHQWENRGAI